uniref:Uncharacterized protein n=1 Tax=Megaselia scalaris TaxID=36166 RepID=T1H1N2_MEGSC
VRDNAQRFDFDLLLPILNAEGNYELNGNLLSLPLKGNGPFVGNFTNFMAFVKQQLVFIRSRWPTILLTLSISYSPSMSTAPIMMRNVFLPKVAKNCSSAAVKFQVSEPHRSTGSKSWW